MTLEATTDSQGRVTRRLSIDRDDPIFRLVLTSVSLTMPVPSRLLPKLPEGARPTEACKVSSSAASLSIAGVTELDDREMLTCLQRGGGTLSAPQQYRATGREPCCAHCGKRTGEIMHAGHGWTRLGVVPGIAAPWASVSSLACSACAQTASEQSHREWQANLTAPERLLGHGHHGSLFTPAYRTCPQRAAMGPRERDEHYYTSEKQRSGVPNDTPKFRRDVVINPRKYHWELREKERLRKQLSADTEVHDRAVMKTLRVLFSSLKFYDVWSAAKDKREKYVTKIQCDAQLLGPARYSLSVMDLDGGRESVWYPLGAERVGWPEDASAALREFSLWPHPEVKMRAEMGGLASGGADLVPCEAPWGPEIGRGS